MPESVVAAGGSYFDTPERDERLQLVAHLLRNAAEPVYLRGPAGAGKTRFCQRLFAELGEEFTCIRLVGAADLDVRSAVRAQLRASVPAGERPRDGGARLLILADDADVLAPAAVETLHTLQREGARLLLCGRGERVPAAGPSGLHLVDLPPLTPAQCREFLAELAPAVAEHLDEQGQARLCAECEGWPGRVLKRAAAAGARPERGAALGGRWGLWGGAAVLLGLAAVAVWQQEAINAWFEPPSAPGAAGPPVAAADRPLVLELPPPTPAVPPAAAPAPAPLPARRGTDGELAPEVTPPVAAEATADRRPVVPPQLPGDSPGLGGADAVAAGDTAAVVDEPVPQPPPRDEPPVEEPPVEEPPVEEPPAPQAAAEARPAPPPVPRPGEQATEPALPAAAPTPDPAAALPSAAAARAEPVDAAAPGSPPALPGADWLRAQPADHYTLQLIGARDLAALRRFANTHGLQGDSAVVVRDLKGKPWYSLVHGSFADREQALRHKAGLDQPMAKDAWPRRFADIR